MKLYYYLPKGGSGIGFSIRGNNLAEIKKSIKSILGVKTLRGVQIWEG